MITINKKDYPEMLQCIQRNDQEILINQTDCLMMLDRNCGIIYADATSEAGAKKILESAKTDRASMVLHGEALPKAALNMGCYELGKPYIFATYMETIPPSRAENRISHKELDQNALDTVLNHYSYQDLAEESYISQRIEAGMIGAYIDEELAGFIGTHDNGSIGMLEVFPRFQRKGVGYDLLQFMIQRLLKQKLLPYSELFIDNARSPNLARKAGMVLSGNTVVWCSPKE